MKKRASFFRIIALGLVLSIILMSILALIASPALAALTYDENIQTMIWVGTKHVKAISESLNSRSDFKADNNDGSGDLSSNTFIYITGINGLKQVNGKYSSDKDAAKKTAIVVWIGESQINHKATDWYSAYFNNDVTCDVFDGYEKGTTPAEGTELIVGHDGSTITTVFVEHHDAVDPEPDDPNEYNGTGLGRALSGYTVYKLVSEQKEGENGPMFVQKPVMQDVIDPTTGLPAEDAEGAPIQEPAVDADGNPMYEDDPDRPVMVDHLEPVHIDGYAEPWINDGCQVYVLGDGPRSRNMDDAGNEMNAPCQTFNSALQTHLSGPRWLDKFYETVLDHRPYFGYSYDDQSGGNFGIGDGGYESHLWNESATSIPWYDKAEFRWIFYMVWNSLLMANPPTPKMDDAIDQSFYSVSSALTAYASVVVTSREPEKGYNDSTLSEANVLNWTSVGSLVGYGDSHKPYKFVDGGYLVSYARNASQASYDSLKTFGKNMYTYAVYGHLLADMGLDSTGLVSSVRNDNVVPGIILLILYIASVMLPFVFHVLIIVLRIINPFGILNIAATFYTNYGTFLSPYLRPRPIPSGWSFVEDIPVLKDAFIKIGEIYGRVKEMGIVVVIPFVLAMIIAGFLLRGGKRKPNVLRKFLIRVVFICVGVPLLGGLYTAVLDSVADGLTAKSYATTSVVASTFVDFEAWVKTSRLTPFSGMVLRSEIGADDDSVSKGGQADGKTIRQLRKTAYSLNSHTGSLDHIINSSSSSLITEEDGVSFDLKVIGTGQLVESTSDFDSILGDYDAVKEASSFITRFMSSDMYSPAEAEADINSAFVADLQKDMSLSGGPDDVMGHRLTKEEREGKNPPDMTGRVYGFYDACNELEDWTKREHDENLDVVLSSSSHHNYPTGFNVPYPNWKNWNFISNGGGISASGGGSSYTFSGSGSNTGMSPYKNKHGLSSLALYNYLSTDFGKNAITVYSNKTSASEGVRYQHYAVNMIGSGAIRTTYMINMIILFLFLSIIGFVYGFGLFFNSVKRTFSMLVQIPLAAAGLLKSIAKVITTFFIMCCELVVTAVVASVVSDLILGLVGLVGESVAVPGTYVGGMIGTVGATNGVSILYDSRFGACLSLAVMSLFIVFLGFVLLKYASVVLAVEDAVMKYVLSLFGVYDGIDPDYEFVFSRKRVNKKIGSVQTECGVLYS